ncbi:MAG: hypothetical protein IPH85_03220 [Ignavibacteria bacterium]|nr:hypothetical protein [Ignavibacteria bacterium]
MTSFLSILHASLGVPMLNASWKRITLITAITLGALAVASFVGYTIFRGTIRENIRSAIVQYIQTRVRAEAQTASDGKLDIVLGDIDYTYYTGSLHVRNIRVRYHDSTEAVGSTMQIDLPELRVTGLLPWDVINGGGLSIGTITLDHPAVRMRSWGARSKPQAPEKDTAVVRLPKLPNVDSLLNKLFVKLVPTNVQPLSIDGVMLVEASLDNHDDDPESQYAGQIHGFTLDIGTITVRADHPEIKPIERVVLKLDRWNRKYSSDRSILVQGLHVIVSDVDSALTVDSVQYHLPSEYTYSASKVLFSYRTRQLQIGGFELGPTQNDETYFKGRRYNSDRFRVRGSNVQLQDIDFSSLSARTALHVRTIDVGMLDLDILSNRRLRVDPSSGVAMMPNELARTIPFMLAVDSVVVGSASIRYGERWKHSLVPALLTWKGIKVVATNLRNSPDQMEKPLTIWAKGTFLSRSTMEATFTMPLTSPVYVLSARGTLGRFDVTELNGFLPIAENVKIKSGIASSAAFSYTIKGRSCTGVVQPHFTDLEIAVLDKKTKESSGIFNSIISFVANWIVIKNDNNGDDYEDGVIRYTLPKDAAIMQTIWFPIREGLGKAAGI